MRSTTRHSKSNPIELNFNRTQSNSIELKSGDPDEPEATRPISLLPIMSKVCERAAHSQFMDFLDKNSKISGLQSGPIESYIPPKPP